MRMPGWGIRHPWLAAICCGILSAAALPPLHVVPVLLVAVPGLLALIGAQARGRGAFWIGLWFGFGQHVPGLYWITEAILFEATHFWWLVPIAVPALALVLAVFIAVPCAVARMMPAGWPRVLMLAGAWVLADLVRQFFASGFPWNPLGSVWAAPFALGDVMQQPASLLGVHGLTLMTLLLAATPVLGRRAMLTGGARLLVWAGLGWARLPTVQAPAQARVALVQGNIPQGEKWGREIALRNFNRYLTMTAHAVDQAHNKPGILPLVVIWPETASPFLLDSDTTARTALARIADGTVVLAGSVRFDAEHRPHNSLMVIADPNAPRAIYDKWHLVPFGEYQPGWMPLPIQLVQQGGFIPGRGPTTLALPGLPAVGPLICYEAIFPGQIVERANRPAWLVNVTNDAWFGNSSGPRQHLAATRLRAVEEGLPLARAANTGISAVFDGYGRELARLGMNQTGTLVADLPTALPPTLFARWGLLLPTGLALLCIGLAVASARKRDTRPRKTVTESA